MQNMQKPLPSDNAAPQLFLRRLNRVVGELNVYLVVLALGLGVVDFVCFVTLRLVDTLARLPNGG